VSAAGGGVTVSHRYRAFPEPVAVKVPAATAMFWVTKLGVAVGGVAMADYLARRSPVLAAVAEAALLIIGLTWQFQVRRYVAAAYWFLVYVLVMFGTGVSDTLYRLARVPYAGVALVWAAVLAGALGAWDRDPELSIRSIVTRRREAIYWTMVFATFAFGAALADFGASSLQLGYGSSVLVFSAATFIPALEWCVRRNSVTTFGWAYTLTWPLGASLADYVSQARAASGLGFGSGRTAAIATLAAAAAVTFLTLTRNGIQPSGDQSCLDDPAAR
jgi:uncharacterized membrane-anchored protein